MTEQHLLKVSQELKLQPRQVAATAALLAEGATVPFIARYRKEKTGEMDEVQITSVRDRLEQLAALDKRREAIIGSLEERNLMTDLLRAKIDAAETLTTLEDIYQPFRPKKRTKATIARELGLEPLAELLWAQDPATDPEAEGARYVGNSVTVDNKTNSIDNVADALAGARDILAERINDDADIRARLRTLYLEQSTIKSQVVTGKEEEGAKFKDYFDWEEPAAKAPSHRILAMRRGETEGFLFTRIAPPEGEALNLVTSQFVRGDDRNRAAAQVRLAAQDCFKRLLSLGMEVEARRAFKQRADEEAIRVFADNLRELLLASPLGQKVTLAIDPGFRTGCKVVLLDRQGKLIANDVIYPTTGAREAVQAAALVKACVEKYKVEAIAIGNGTASRETEAFVKKLGLPPSVVVVMVSESGASIYSASEVAREEFPDKDVTVRGAVSIGRRLMDPLAELVKLDPKSIGVGQYQHDVDQDALKRSLDDVVISCVNNVGVEINTASRHLLAYVSGLNSRVAANIVAHRDENGPFQSRKDLLKVTGLGPKAFEQAAGFLRIRDGKHPLDSDVGLPTLKDILSELSKPGRDPRQQFEAFSFQEGVEEMKDLKLGMKLPGIVTNVTAFGAFVDVGVHQDGLVHISQLSDQFVKNPADVVKVGQRVMATVMEVDLGRKRIALSLKSNADPTAERKPQGDRGGDRRDFDRNGPRRGGPNDRGGRPQPRREEPGNDWFSMAQQKRH
jgi:uncharacterized protein